MCLLHYSLFLSSFILTLFLPLQIGFVSSCCVSILPMFILCERGYRLLGLPCFLLSFFFFFFFFLLHAFSTTVFILFLHTFLAMFVISFGLVFLSLTQFLLLTFSIVPCFFSLCFFILVFTSILLYKRIWAFMDLYQSKGSCTQFAIIYQSHSIKDLYSTANMYSTVDLYSAADHFPLHFFLSPSISVGFCFFSVFFGLFLLFGLFGGPLGFAFYWAFFLMGFWVRIYKNEHQQI